MFSVVVRVSAVSDCCTGCVFLGKRVTFGSGKGIKEMVDLAYRGGLVGRTDIGLYQFEARASKWYKLA